MHIQTTIGPADGSNHLLVEARPYLTRSDDMDCRITIEAEGQSTRKVLAFDEANALHLTLGSILAAWPRPL